MPNEAESAGSTSSSSLLLSSLLLPPLLSLEDSSSNVGLKATWHQKNVSMCTHNTSSKNTTDH
jgi:hypothetical protein